MFGLFKAKGPAAVRKAVERGLSANAALAALTTTPADLLGIADRAGTLYNFTEHWALGTELYSFLPTVNTNDWQLLTTLGLVYTFNSNWAVKTSISHTLRDVSHGGPNPSAVFYVVWNF